MRKSELIEFGMWTRRRPIGRDYAAAKDAEVGIEVRNQKTRTKAQSKTSAIASLSFQALDAFLL